MDAQPPSSTAAVDAAFAREFARRVPDRVRRAALVRCGGYRVVADLVSGATLRALRAEALARAPLARRYEAEPLLGDREEVRGGSPARRLASAPGGQVQDALYRDPELHARLVALAGVPLAPTGPRGSYSYYLRAGDHLALHRDIESCDLTLITCLLRTVLPRPHPDAPGVLRLHPERMLEPLSTLQARPDPAAVDVDLRPGDSLAFFGGLVPHALRPLAPGQRRVVSVLCFRA